ncbi:MAG: peptide chain release factor N(5)-glutamine methyltransferase [Ignavibacteriaceae bacterium]|nr:peptide chain release factor N(5)-glutamine methyltransferase [Ignavibacteriaceae bacterium]
MLTVLEVLKSSANYLENKGIKSARLNSELLLSHALKCRRLDLYLSFDRPLQKHELDLYRELLKRRSTHEPLQYIIGSVEFYGLEFKINPSVLIPRPETELLVENVIQNLKQIESPKILDIGSGSGNITIALAKNLNGSSITGVDLSIEAIKTSEKNAELHNVKDRVNFVCRDIFNAWDFDLNAFDAIVSNPPYISNLEFENIDDEVKLFEPRNALTDGLDGLSYYKRICLISKSLLKKSGRLFFELGFKQSNSVHKILNENGFKNIVIKKDYSDIDRVIYGELS